MTCFRECGTLDLGVGRARAVLGSTMVVEGHIGSVSFIVRLEDGGADHVSPDLGFKV